ncbi:MAG: class I SAM-dependent methyltransferase [Acidobacteria bacterium]|nr:class I SAM-dependent methyltransferase [Acidobacteriota bacterium]
MTLQKSGAFWDSEVTTPTHASWLAEPAVRAYVNEMITGSPYIWPFDALQQYLGAWTGGRALSIGCGTGSLERDLIRRGLFEQVDGFDGSVGSLAIARSEAAKAGVGASIHYFAADFNAPRLPRARYDAVLIHQALHHVAALEKLFLAIGRTLKPGGFVYFDEYTGPSRDDWNDDLLEFHQSIFREIPAEVRTTERLALPIQPDDPSEAVRSSEIVQEILRGFEVVEKREYGGAVLSVLYPAIDWERAGTETLQWLIEKDREALDSGQSYHAVALLRRRSPLARTPGTVHYYLWPKLRGLRFRIRRALGNKSARW